MYAFVTVYLGLLWAQGGALPKGDLGGADAGKATQPAKDQDDKRRNCLADLMEPPGGNVVFTKDGFYLLASAGPAYKLVKKGGEALKNRYTLYKVQMPEKKAEAVVALDQKGDSSLLVYGDPLEAVSVLSFIGKQQSCYEGAGGLVSVSLAKKGAKAVQGTGAFVLARSPEGYTLVDTKKMQVAEMDTKTFQTKMVRRVRDAERPLWFDPADRRMIAFHDDGKNRGLIDYAVDDEKKARRLTVKAGDKIVQSGKAFAVCRLNTKKNKIELEELPEWSGPTKPGTYQMALPAAYPVQTAGLDAHFGKRVALVFGNSYLAKQQWQRVFLFDYTREDPIAATVVAAKMYVNFAGIEPGGAYAAVEVRDRETRATTGLRVFNFSSKKFEDVKLPAPDGAKD